MTDDARNSVMLDQHLAVVLSRLAGLLGRLSRHIGLG